MQFPVIQASPIDLSAMPSEHSGAAEEDQAASEAFASLLQELLVLFAPSVAAVMDDSGDAAAAEAASAADDAVTNTAIAANAGSTKNSTSGLAISADAATAATTPGMAFPEPAETSPTPAEPQTFPAGAPRLLEATEVAAAAHAASSVSAAETESASSSAQTEEVSEAQLQNLLKEAPGNPKATGVSGRRVPGSGAKTATLSTAVKPAPEEPPPANVVRLLGNKALAGSQASVQEVSQAMKKTPERQDTARAPDAVNLAPPMALPEPKSSAAGPAPLASTAATVKLDEIVEQVVQTVKLNLRHEESSVRLQLHPPALGELGVEIFHQGEDVAVRLVSQNPGVREALQAQVQMLRDSLTRDGVQTAQVVVAADPSLGLQFQKQSQRGTGQQYTGAARRAPSKQSYIEAPADLSDSTRPVGAWHPGELNVFV
ncbi:MAG: flagellar hook-length control protein FliK [Candidatus Hydrogenedentes bacterium]|nr:flagellar hook-length control protein FliK [Candidatus Hydrogenedentota bacterium]